mmetsp:Transcript_29325/g.67505  ORF Transcript_29325/g.67505 Transcript_29325/m.67505 type:complete len:396 (+) Transcript_29325:86-1273(+)
MYELSIDTESIGSDPGCETIVVSSDDDDDSTSELFWPSTPEMSLEPRHRCHGLSAATTCQSVSTSSWASGTYSCEAGSESSWLGSFPPQVPTMSWGVCSESSSATDPPTDSLQRMTYVCPVVAHVAPMQVMMNTTQPQAPAMPQGCLSTVPVQTSPCAGAADGEEKAAIIARLQELLQAPEHTALFKFPPGVKVLQWSFHEKREGRLQFRAVLHFLCNGVPHHATGGWWPSKKEARQNAAEVGFALLQGLQLDSMSAQSALTCTDLSPLQPGPCTRQARAAKGDCLERFQSLLAQCPMVTDTSAEWSSVLTEDSNEWQAMVTVRLFGVKHTFSGPGLTNLAEAKLEAAKRVLWYLGSAGFEGFFVPHRRALLATRCQVPAAPKEWTTSLTRSEQD